jgi:UDP-N-acetylglucosamine--N-acetylmuramyl-(pentapeptide) pyrophosphoryl-undecaprenol N-acetylglucosamine transferase
VPALANDRDRLTVMGASAARLIPRDADDKLAAIVAEVAGGGR